MHALLVRRRKLSTHDGPATPRRGPRGSTTSRVHHFRVPNQQGVHRALRHGTAKSPPLPDLAACQRAAGRPTRLGLDPFGNHLKDRVRAPAKWWRERSSMPLRRSRMKQRMTGSRFSSVNGRRSRLSSDDGRLPKSSSDNPTPLMRSPHWHSRSASSGLAMKVVSVISAVSAPGDSLCCGRRRLDLFRQRGVCQNQRWVSATPQFGVVPAPALTGGERVRQYRAESAVQ